MIPKSGTRFSAKRSCSNKKLAITSVRCRRERLALCGRLGASRGMTADVSVLAALFAGLISFLSPCVLPLVPPYLVYLAGSSLERLAEAEPVPLVKRDVLVAALLFVAGFSTVFVALGAAVSSISVGLRGLQAVLAGWLADMKLALTSATGWDVPISDDPFAIIAGLIIIVMGLHFLGITPIAF